MQAYFMMPNFMEAISRFQPNQFLLESYKALIKRDPKKSTREFRKFTSSNLVMELQRLFARLCNSAQKSIDTKGVTSKIVDDFGVFVNIGEQKDVGEFNINFLARIHDGLDVNMVTKDHKDELNIMEEKELQRSIQLGLSVLLPITKEQLDKSFIYNTFFGSFSIVTKGLDYDGNEISLDTNTTFSQIIINANGGNLYKGWEENYYTVIDDFQTSKVDFLIK